MLQSGLPYTVAVAGSPSNTSAGSRANLVPGANPIPSNQNINFWFDPAAFTTPPAFTWGTLGRNSLNAPALYNFDFSVAKKFRFGESRELQFRSEFFNALNHPWASERDRGSRRRRDNYVDAAGEPADAVRSPAGILMDTPAMPVSRTVKRKSASVSRGYCMQRVKLWRGLMRA